MSCGPALIQSRTTPAAMRRGDGSDFRPRLSIRSATLRAISSQHSKPSLKRSDRMNASKSAGGAPNSSRHFFRSLPTSSASRWRSAGLRPNPSDAHKLLGIEMRGWAMQAHANFRVDPRLASLLGESYRSTEQALRELVDNAWDADANNVRITLPQPMIDDPIVVSDDGSGMTEGEVRRHYLMIANDRYSRRGTKTTRYARSVRGRKGIGKFAGLVAAEDMCVETYAHGKSTTLNISKTVLLQAKGDLEKVDLPIIVHDCNADKHGTTITLSRLNSRFTLPSPEALRELLALEYGRFSGFTILVNEEPLSHEDIQGQVFSKTVELPNAGTVTLRFTVMTESKGARHAGIVTRVGGKIVGKPSMFGLDNQD